MDSTASFATKQTGAKGFTKPEPKQQTFRIHSDSGANLLASKESFRSSTKSISTENLENNLNLANNDTDTKSTVSVNSSKTLSDARGRTLSQCFDSLSMSALQKTPVPKNSSNRRKSVVLSSGVRVVKTRAPIAAVRKTANTARSASLLGRTKPISKVSSVQGVTTVKDPFSSLVPPFLSTKSKFDHKGRYVELEAYAEKLRLQLIELLSNDRKPDSHPVEALKAELQLLKETHAHQIEDAYSALLREKESLLSASVQISSLQSELSTVKDRLIEQQTKCEILELSNSTLQAQNEILAETLRFESEKATNLANENKTLRENVCYLEGKGRAEEALRRKLHNTVQELKGNIRVFCRFRPLSSDESEKIVVPYRFPEFTDSRVVEVETTQNSVVPGKPSTTKNYQFSFDKVFPGSASQHEVFDEISQLVQSAIDGYRVCIFAYGQTGSGKTYTMEGSGYSPSSPIESKGMIPRSVSLIFSKLHEMKMHGWTYSVEISMMEIYNEQLRDLLSASTVEKNYDIKHEANGNTIISDMTTIKVDGEEHVQMLIKKAAENRSVASTKCNERSSRSHSIFQMKLTGSNEMSNETTYGVLNLIDLAGSERLSQSQVTGDRLKETQSINKSLSCLGDVIMALGNKEKHVPYRNSKLTYLLQNALGGNSKALMFVNASPHPDNLSETLNSLRFASKVNACEIGQARRLTLSEPKKSS